MPMDTCFGMDTDEVFAYSTKKVVWIRDRWVGAIYYSIVLLVLLWVVGGQLIYRNEQFLLKDVKGLARIWYSHPTKKNCEATDAGCESDFRSFTELPYCAQYSGIGAGSQKAHCKYQSKVSIAPEGISNHQLFVPTAVEVIEERIHCDPTPENGYTCDNEYEAVPGEDCLHDGYLCKKRGGKQNMFYYVADVKNFKVRLTSSYERDNVRGTSLMHPAYVGLCRSMLRYGNVTRGWKERSYRNQLICERKELERYKMRCVGGSCTQVRDFDILSDTGIRAAAEEMHREANTVARGVQDMGHARVGPEETVLLEAESFTESLSESGLGESEQKRRHGGLRSKHKITGLSLSSLTSFGDEVHPALTPRHKEDEYSDRWGDVFSIGRLFELAGADLDLDYNMDNWTTRQSGTAIQIRAVYNNLYPIISSFGYRDVEYHYEVRELMLPYMSRTVLSAVQPPEYPKVRRYDVSYGVLVSFEVGGTFGFFNVVYLILMLTTALALTASATTITDLLGIYVFPRRDNFFHLKYEVSPDFSMTWRCTECGFHNVEGDETCQGVPKFKSRMDEKPCGAPRVAKS
mmetsp:Transcript_58999/g.151718  ORF Transcript_58999/g.151718 Transcript_58999/m.151718 type:complete len:574 (+) Transcript_58999:72-1793(+)|eukprot:CAMPEP_0195136502 /NCGR_PEP_ID=MMETSP0448-20130528/154357_1 /TAXON_ID=66468 /ORGANISM="Heterocapsa triquestra, Strain CCMP 448" /LENGTH=573 /DNA_ID=CAMNT_0040174693 /DNA_START=48 /DNA_END=1769 /DNA_ORIENTATION=-